MREIIKESIEKADLGEIIIADDTSSEMKEEKEENEEEEITVMSFEGK